MGRTRLGDPQAVEAEQAHQPVAVPALVLAGGQQVGELVAVEPRLRATGPLGSTHPRAGLPTVTSSSSSQRNQELSVAMRR
ncbi:MAG TPA: hypothetical protein VM287_09000 [Egibacteraceae bacterium]|nr:hypothetical protein [Egibacteraceae bacterium]